MLRDEGAIEVCLQHIEISEVVDDDEVGGIAGAEEADGEVVMKNRVDGCGAQDIIKVVALCEGALYEVINVVEHEFIGVFIVAAKHDFIGVQGYELRERFEVFCGATFADEYVHADVYFIERLREREAFVIGGDACCGIGGGFCAPHTGSVAINGFTGTGGSLYFGDHFGVLVKYSGVVHHF